jgi:hypothetical protein
MNTVELLPALQFHCHFCTGDSWHDCTLRTGKEAVYAFMEKIQQTVEAQQFVDMIRKRAQELDMRVPAVPDFKGSYSIQANGICCKMCGNAVGCLKGGYRFICDFCALDNYLIPIGEVPKTAKCEHCGSSFRTEHFMSEGANNGEDN